MTTVIAVGSSSPLMLRRLQAHVARFDMRYILGLTTALLLLSCGPTTVKVGTTRVIDEKAVGFARRPICLAPPDARLSLTDVAQSKKVNEICERAAKLEGIAVLPPTSGDCLVASIHWYAFDTGTRVGGCSRDFSGSNCESVALFQKNLQLKLKDPKDQHVVLESTSALQSNYAEFNDKSFGALCQALFGKYPEPLQSEQFDIAVE